MQDMWILYVNFESSATPSYVFVKNVYWMRTAAIVAQSEFQEHD
jgi:hypothetical protein